MFKKSYFRVLLGAAVLGLMSAATVWAGSGETTDGRASYSDVYNAKKYWVRFKNKSDRNLYLRCKKKSKTTYIYLRADATRSKYLAKGKYKCKCADSRHGRSKKHFKLKVSKRSKSVSAGKKCGYR